MTCVGLCNQGRKQCPTPYECVNPTYDNSMEMLGMLAIYLLGILTGTVLAWLAYVIWL